MAKAPSGGSEIAETLKVKVEPEKPLTQVVDQVKAHLESRNDGNKVYKFEKFSYAQNGDEIKNLGCLV